MKIAVMGVTWLIGSQVVRLLNAGGHEAVPCARSTGVDLLSGEGLRAALNGADVVVDVTSSPTFDDASTAIFRTTTENLLVVASYAEVGHAVLLSIVGADLVRTVVTDNTACIFAAVSGDALIAKDGAVIAPTTYREWLRR